MSDMNEKAAEYEVAWKTGYQAAVREVVAMLEKEAASYPVGAHGHAYIGLAAGIVARRFLSAPAAEADPRMAAIAYGQSDEYRERFLREKQPPSPSTPPAAEVCEWKEDRTMQNSHYTTSCGHVASADEKRFGRCSFCGEPVRIKPLVGEE